MSKEVSPEDCVVNCFRSLYLWGNLQLVQSPVAVMVSCELLSFFVPLGEFTAPLQFKIR